LTNSEVFNIVHSLYDVYSKNPNITVTCRIETKHRVYSGKFVFDEKEIISDNILTLCDTIIADKVDTTDYIRDDKTIISFSAITVFSFSIKN